MFSFKNWIKFLIEPLFSLNGCDDVKVIRPPARTVTATVKKNSSNNQIELLGGGVNDDPKDFKPYYIFSSFATDQEHPAKGEYTLRENIMTYTPEKDFTGTTAFKYTCSHLMEQQDGKTKLTTSHMTDIIITVEE